MLGLVWSGQAVAQTQPDCHGPLYYKLKNQDKEQRTSEAARAEVDRFVDSAGGKLVAANLAEGTALLAQRKGEWLDCLARTRRPSVLCLAVVRADEKLCSALSAPERREPCLMLSRVATAVKAGRAELCAAMGEVPERRLCELAAGGGGSCDGLPEGAASRVCRAVAAKAGGKASGLSPEEAVAVAWVRALSAREAAGCDAIPESRERGVCRAAAAGSEEACPLDRPTIEHVDGDYSCRNLVLSHRVHSSAAGTELVVRLGGDFPGKADCQVKARLAGSKERIVGSVHPDRGLDLTEIRALVEGPVEGVEATCRWDLESSRFIPKESEAGVW